MYPIKPQFDVHGSNGLSPSISKSHDVGLEVLAISTEVKFVALVEDLGGCLVSNIPNICQSIALIRKRTAYMSVGNFIVHCLADKAEVNYHERRDRGNIMSARSDELVAAPDELIGIPFNYLDIINQPRFSCTNSTRQNSHGVLRQLTLNWGNILGEDHYHRPYILLDLIWESHERGFLLFLVACKPSKIFRIPLDSYLSNDMSNGRGLFRNQVGVGGEEVSILSNILRTVSFEQHQTRRFH